MLRQKSLLVGSLLLLCGCVSQIASLKEGTEHWLGQPIEELKEADSRPSANDSYAVKIGWKETTYSLDSGNWVYVQLVRKDCFIHWEVNPQGIIVGSRTEGKGCRWQ